MNQSWNICLIFNNFGSWWLETFWIAWQCLKILGIVWQCSAMLSYVLQCLEMLGYAWYILGLASHSRDLGMSSHSFLLFLKMNFSWFEQNVCKVQLCFKSKSSSIASSKVSCWNLHEFTKTHRRYYGNLQKLALMKCSEIRNMCPLQSKTISVPSYTVGWD